MMNCSGLDPAPEVRGDARVCCTGCCADIGVTSARGKGWEWSFLQSHAGSYGRLMYFPIHSICLLMQPSSSAGLSTGELSSAPDPHWEVASPPPPRWLLAENLTSPGHFFLVLTQETHG